MVIFKKRNTCFAVVATTLLVVLCLHIPQIEGFVVGKHHISGGRSSFRRSKEATTTPWQQQQQQQLTSHDHNDVLLGPLLFQSNDDDELNDSRRAIDGTGRGVVLQGVVLFICIWIFSIPPEFRRAYFCAAPSCEANRTQCNNCVTPKEWADDIAEYYKNGGGVKFDFSIGEETKNAYGLDQ